MKTLKAKSTDKDGRDKFYDLKKLREIDEEQGREHLTGTEIDCVIALGVARQMVTDANEGLKRFGRNKGFLAASRTAETKLRRSMETIRDGISSEQLIMVANNINDCDIVISSNPVLGLKQMINVDRVQLAHIITQASRVCSLTCSCTREESKACTLRHAFDVMPGVKKSGAASMGHRRLPLSNV